MCTTASDEARSAVYVDGFRMSPFAQVTEVDHDGGLGDEVTEDQDGSPERLRLSGNRVAYSEGVGIRYRGHVPAAGHGRLANAGAEKAAAACNDEALFGGLSHDKCVVDLSREAQLWP